MAQKCMAELGCEGPGSVCSQPRSTERAEADMMDTV